MKLSKAINYINSALNYPSITYKDISLYLDMAISDLNTTLHTAIPSVSVMTQEFRQKMSKNESNKLILTAENNPIDNDYEIPTSDTGTPDCYYDGESKKYYIYDIYKQEYRGPYTTIFGLYNDGTALHIYQSINYGDTATWAEVPGDPNVECDLEDYLPDNWVLLFLIPYVCYKYSVRDGGTAQTFAEELTQGFQQLQDTYDIPSTVFLFTYADKPAYTPVVVEHLPDLNVKVSTRAIYEDMVHSREVNAVFGSMYDRGGFE